MTKEQMQNIALDSSGKAFLDYLKETADNLEKEGRNHLDKTDEELGQVVRGTYLAAEEIRKIVRRVEAHGKPVTKSTGYKI